MTMFKDTSKAMRRLCSTMENFQEGMFYMVQRIDQMDHPDHRLHQLSISTQRIADKLDPVLEHTSVALQSFTDTSEAVRDLATETRKVLTILDPSSVNSLVRSVNYFVTEVNEAIRLLIDLLKLGIIFGLILLLIYGVYQFA